MDEEVLPGGVRAKLLGASGREVYEVDRLVQDLSFDHAATKVVQTPEGDHLLACGEHPPQLACFHLSNLSPKWRRHASATILDLVTLSSDWSKCATLLDSRTIALHARHGLHASLRVPSPGRCLEYSATSACLFTGCSDSWLYRLNLEQGRFLRPVDLHEDDGVECLSCSHAHELIAAGCGSGQLALVDPRLPRKCASMHLPSSVTTLSQHPSDGLSLACGLDDGQVMLFDLRSPNPVATMSHGHSAPARSMQFVGRSNDGNPSELLVSADRRGVKAWHASSGSPFLAFDTKREINHCLVYDNSGLILTAEESGSIVTRYAPDIGPAPKWCTSIESLPEDVAREGAPSSTGEHEDMRFVTRDELSRLGLEHLQGTNLLKPHMHGFFLHAKLYHKVRAIADPDPQRTARRERLEKKMRQQRETRITVPKRLPKVNKQIAEKYAAAASATSAGSDTNELNASDQDASNKKSKSWKKAELAGSNPLTDERFTRMFHDNDFEIDPNSRDYQLVHPNTTNKRRRAMEEEEEEETRSQDALVAEHFRDERDEGGAGDGDDGDGNGADGAAPVMLEARGKRNAEAYSAGKSLKEQHSLSLAEREKKERSKQAGVQKKRRDVGSSAGNKEISFEPRKVPSRKKR